MLDPSAKPNDSGRTLCPCAASDVAAIATASDVVLRSARDISETPRVMVGVVGLRRPTLVIEAHVLGSACIDSDCRRGLPQHRSRLKAKIARMSRHATTLSQYARGGDRHDVPRGTTARAR